MKGIIRLFLILVLFASICNAVVVEIEPFKTYEGLYITVGVVGVLGILSGGVYGVATGVVLIGNAINLCVEAKKAGLK
jgi:hypothetical protein